MAKAKFKVGDIVIAIRDGHDNGYEPMIRKGTTYRVLGVTVESSANYYCVQQVGSMYLFGRIREDMFKLYGRFNVLESADVPAVKPKRRIVIEITDDGAVAKEVGDNRVKRTVSIHRHSDDEPNDEYAATCVIAKFFGRDLRKIDEAIETEAKNQSEAIGGIDSAILMLQAAKEAVKRI